MVSEVGYFSTTMCPHTATCVCSTAAYVSSLPHVCALLLHRCHHTATCVLVLLRVSAYVRILFMCPHTGTCVSSYCCICVLILLHVSAYCYICLFCCYMCVRMLLHICTHTATCPDTNRRRRLSKAEALSSVQCRILLDTATY